MTDGVTAVFADLPCMFCTSGSLHGCMQLRETTLTVAAWSRIKDTADDNLPPLVELNLEVLLGSHAMGHRRWLACREWLRNPDWYSRTSSWNTDDFVHASLYLTGTGCLACRAS